MMKKNYFLFFLFVIFFTTLPASNLFAIYFHCSNASGLTTVQGTLSGREGNEAAEAVILSRDNQVGTHSKVWLRRTGRERLDVILKAELLHTSYQLQLGLDIFGASSAAPWTSTLTIFQQQGREVLKTKHKIDCFELGK